MEFLEECSNEDLKVLAEHGQRLHMNFNSMAGIVLLTSFGDMECHIVKS